MQYLAVTRGVNLCLKFILALPAWIMRLRLIPHLLMLPLVSSALGLLPLQLTFLNLLSASSHRQQPPFFYRAENLLSNFYPPSHFFLPPHPSSLPSHHIHIHWAPTESERRKKGGEGEGGLLLLLTLRGSQDLPVNELIFHPASIPPPSR